jgi:TorA maturation chaperone TorD
MTGQERDDFCQVMARLVSPPDLDLARQVHEGTLRSFLERCVRELGGEETMVKGFVADGRAETLLIDLRGEYARLFTGQDGSLIFLVESCYKSWTKDLSCSLPFASETGLLMGDPGIHLLEVYRRCDLEVAEEFRSCPDHLAMELEFLSYLYRWTSEREVKRFITDHLDWISGLKEKCKPFDPHPFYGNAIEILALFIQKERERLEAEESGKKTLH